MQKYSNDSLCTNQLLSCVESPQQRSIREENELIEMYLNLQVFYQRTSQGIDFTHDENINSQQEKTLQSTTETQKRPSLTEDSMVFERKKRSVFHNFQKHLITIVKKYIHMAKSKTGISEIETIAYQLYQAFMKTNSFNKRLLHTVFGVQGQRANEGLQRLFQEFPEFKKVSFRYNQEKIRLAQAIIRESAVQQASHLSKFFLKSNSSITKFDSFYEYYSSFIKEISKGPMSKRLTKCNKQTVLQNMKDKNLA